MSNLNYFELLNLPVQFNLSRDEIESKYYQAILKHHPDKSKTEAGSDLTSLINKAYSELSEPLKRAIHLCQLNGIELDENFSQNQLDGNNQVQMNKEFLFETMSLYERLERLSQNKQNAEILNFQKELSQKMDSIFDTLQLEVNNQNWKGLAGQVLACQFYSQILKKSQSLLN